MARFVVSFAAMLMIGCAGKKTALLLIDVQDCFLDKNTTSGNAGTLPVTNAHQIIPLINSIRAQKSCLFDKVFLSRDYHPTKHISFGSTHGLAPYAHFSPKGELPLKCLTSTGATSSAACCPGWYLNKSAYNCSQVLCPPDNFVYDTSAGGVIHNNPACTQCSTIKCNDTTQALWTDHCLQTGDSTFAPNLTREATDIVIKKGMNRFVDAYSAFMDNTQTLLTTLNQQLLANSITDIYVAGIATDVCVRWTVRDALSNRTGNFNITVIEDATAGITTAGTTAAIAAMRSSGAYIVQTADVLNMACPSPFQQSASNADACKMGAFVWLLVFLSAWQFKAYSS